MERWRDAERKWGGGGRSEPFRSPLRVALELTTQIGGRLLLSLGIGVLIMLP